MKTKKRPTKYAFCGASIESGPYDATGCADVRVLVKTKAGNFHTLFIKVNVWDAIRLRSVLNGLCATFKERVGSLWVRL